MNSEDAKKLSLPDLLARLGHSPVKVTKGGLELWYQSPFREETTASFHTSFLGGKWIWNDFADRGGTVVDFAMRYANVTTVREALAFLDCHPVSRVKEQRHPENTPDLFSFQQQHREAVENFSADRQLELISAHPITSPAILFYLTQERYIPAELAKQYLLEVRYRNLAVGKPFYGFGMLNESGGYEVRVALPTSKFKSAILARDISVVPGTNPIRQSVCLFEGMTDFLSLLVMQGKKQLPEDAIIMHSLSSHARTVAYLKAHPYPEIKTYLDNNPAGQKGTEQLKAELGPAVVSYSDTFAPHVDLNDALQAMHRKRGNRTL
ncbi:hypothetical protein BWI93_25040 [Siphonobacter sp. BAB-5385]|uniref:toprim domain-containing protein n=1 Tax=Siphonobacter sp. BAB-5385 TaxID=1864822 RepID=UPI000B9ECB45|nr:toprim domain-containing protein [Siphonobacter sp. BAB-5385]OZI05534.1 hypothetical protein BWI93_25040 [Siphonobacter sp. BAB-5385]